MAKSFPVPSAVEGEELTDALAVGRLAIHQILNAVMMKLSQYNEIEQLCC